MEMVGGVLLPDLGKGGGLQERIDHSNHHIFTHDNTNLNGSTLAVFLSLTNETCIIPHHSKDRNLQIDL